MSDESSNPNRRNSGVTAEYIGAAAAERHQPRDLADILERVLDTGIVIAGEIRIDLLDIELLTIRLRLVVTSVDKAEEIGLDWWRTDPWFSSSAPRPVPGATPPPLRDARPPDDDDLTLGGDDADDVRLAGIARSVERDGEVEETAFVVADDDDADGNDNDHDDDENGNDQDDDENDHANGDEAEAEDPRAVAVARTIERNGEVEEAAVVVTEDDDGDDG